MTAAYNIILIPLDSADPNSAVSLFTARLVCNLEFSAGTLDSTEIARAIAVHPFFSGPNAPSLNAFALEYDKWRAGKFALTENTPDVIPVSLTYIGSHTPNILRANLANYLLREGQVTVSQITHDNRFDQLQAADFFDVAKMHDDLTVVRTDLHERAARRFGFSRSMSLDAPSLDRSSYAQAKWLDAYVQASLVDAVFAPATARNMPATPAAASALSSLRTAVAQMQKRMVAQSATRSPPETKLRQATATGETTVSSQDPNVALHAALKNEALARACGLVSPWRAQSQKPIKGDYVIVLSASGLALNPTVAGVTTQRTAFRRKEHTHPLSYKDVNKATTTNCGLAFLNEPGGSPRYRSTAINAETATFQATILQSNNSLSNSSPPGAATSVGNRDDRPPQLLSGDHFGSNELEAVGITISAPTEDLVTPDDLASTQRSTLLPCLFLEDLWVGFRLDLSDGKGGKYLSVHKQSQEIRFRASGVKIQGTLEDFFDREQFDPTKKVTSTEVARYTGFNSAQAVDYAKFLGVYKEPIFPEPPPFTVSVTGYSGATPLRFGRVYPWRMRNVFVGGISLSDGDPNLETLGSSFVQNCPFYRARAFRPGELVSLGSKATSPGAEGRPIFLTEEHPQSTVWLIPSPIDSDTARYHGVFLLDQNEPARNSHRAFVTDITKFFAKHPAKPQYYLDPSINEISVQITLLNGQATALNREFMYHDGSFCELVEHFRFPAERLRFGPSGQWEKFRPLSIVFTASSGATPRVTVSEHRRIQITVPPASDIEVSLIPVVTKSDIMSTASYAASAMQLTGRQSRGTQDATWAPVPTIVEHKLRAIHCPKKPLATPRFISTESRVGTQTHPTLAARRERYKETAELTGYLHVDAASTGQLRLDASWSDITDDPKHEKFITNAGRTSSKPKSIGFDKFAVPHPGAAARSAFPDIARSLRQGSYALNDMFDLQCSENKVFLGSTTPDGLAPQSSRACILNFADGRRKRATVTAVATSRYKSQFKGANPTEFEVRSDSLSVDVPASVKLSSPDVSHLVPLARDIVHGDEKARKSRKAYALRIYIRRPWFLSGPGERVAVGCRSGFADDGPVASLNKYVTQWGEDPVERPRLEITYRLPRASDFSIPTGMGALQLDDLLYPPNSLEGNAPLIYRDNLVRSEGSPDPRNDRISVASFAVRWDSGFGLWFCDVGITDGFAGWCGFALYRHQPHAHEGAQLSETPAWVYGAVLHGEQLAWFKQSGRIHVTIGPVHDRYTSFEFDSTQFRNGVSRNLTGHERRRVALRKYLVGDHAYFEGVVDSNEVAWSITKMRFGSDVASLPLHEGT
ncbi:hypothetical protein Q2941_44510 [Bradyrhizobium sp. UFLA05-153]